MYNFKKMLASVLAVGTVATSIASLPAEAGSLIEQNSLFSYDLAVEGTADGLVKVTFYTTNNPGVHEIGLALIYDKDNLEWVNTCPDVNYSNSMMWAKYNNAETGVCIQGGSVNTQIQSTQIQNGDYVAPFAISFYFSKKDSSSNLETYNFGASIYSYKSIAEGKDFENETYLDASYGESSMGVVSNGEYTRKIGDVIPDSVIRLEDAVEVLSLIAACDDTGLYSSSTLLNTYLTSGFSSQLSNGSTLVWNQRFANTLYANNVAFAEVADCDQNGLIEQADADMLIEYYGQQSAAQSPESLINTEISKVVYAEITV